MTTNEVHGFHGGHLEIRNERGNDMPTLLTARGSVERLAEEVMERVAHPTEVWGIPTGFTQFDRLTHGIQQEEMIVVVARPGVGKSAWVGKVAKNVAKHFKTNGTNKVVRIISLEMSYDSWMQRLACNEANLSVSKVMSGNLTTNQYDEYMRCLDYLGGLPIQCIDSSITVDSIERFVRQDGTCGLFVVDHIGITPGTDAKAFNVLNSASTLYRELSKSVAPSIIVSQQNRASEMREDKRPRLSDVYGSDRIGQDARKVIGLYRDDVFQRLSEEDRRQPMNAELSIIKSNNGPLGIVPMLFHPLKMDWREE